MKQENKRRMKENENMEYVNNVENEEGKKDW